MTIDDLQQTAGSIAGLAPSSIHLMLAEGVFPSFHWDSWHLRKSKERVGLLLGQKRELFLLEEFRWQIT
jgi:hypothetical protein